MEKTEIRSQINYSHPALDATIQASDYEAYYPLNSTQDNNNPIQFNIPSNNSRFVDYFNSFLYVKVNIKRADGNKIDSTDIVCPTSNFLHMMFKNCVVQVNNTVVSDSSNYYSYIAWLNNNLAFGEGVKNSQLSAELFYKDTDQDNNDPTKNDSFKTRQGIAADSVYFEVLGRLQTELFTQKKYLPPNVNTTITLFRNTPEFALSANTDSKSYNFHIQECTLYLRKHLLTNIASEFVAKLPEFYIPLRRNDVRTVALGIGSTGCSNEVLFAGKLPDRILLGLVSAEAYSGKYTKSATNFLPYGISNASISINGVKYRELQLDFDNGKYLVAYQSIIKAEENPYSGNYIDRDDYKKGNSIYLFDIGSVMGGSFQQEQEGKISLDLQFKAPLTSALIAVVFAQSQAILQIEKNDLVAIK